MNLIHKIEKWGDSHHPKFLDIIRIALGVFLFLKGLGFMDNTANLKSHYRKPNGYHRFPGSVNGTGLLCHLCASGRRNVNCTGYTYPVFVHYADTCSIWCGIFHQYISIAI